MFRLKARKFTGDDWVPLIIKPEIVKQYSQSEVVTLHQKNLLLLGEDRFLTTILIRTFPNRKMMFLPQAKCRTVVPDTFPVLLSQRRRWINSTIHNLMELVLVQNLCGTFCFSMQFVVFMDLLGTVVLPVAIVLTYILIVGVILNPPKSFEEAIPVLLLGAVLGLPAVLILITTRKVVYVFWMLIYLLALPVWNFILPVYAFWHFDDFSWGETRWVGSCNLRTNTDSSDQQESCGRSQGRGTRRWSSSGSTHQRPPAAMGRLGALSITQAQTRGEEEKRVRENAPRWIPGRRRLPHHSTRSKELRWLRHDLRPFFRR